MRKKILVSLLLLGTCLAAPGLAQEKKKDDWSPDRINYLRAQVNNAIKTRNFGPEAKKAQEELAKLEAPGGSPPVGIFLGGAELNNGLSYYSKNQFSQAEALFSRVIQMREGAYGPNDWLLAPPLSYMAMCYEKTSKPDLAIDTYKRSTALGLTTMQTKKLTDPRVPMEMVSQTLSHDLNAMAQLLMSRGRNKEAEAALWQALQIEKATATGPKYRKQTNANYRAVLRKTGRWADSMTIQPPSK